jgi:hypothetical protein
MMQTKAIVIEVVVCVAVVLALGMPLWAGEKDVKKGIGGEPEEVTKPDEALKTPPEGRSRHPRVSHPGPTIRNFYIVDPREFYGIDGYH